MRPYPREPPAPTPSDTQLVGRILAGEVALFELLVRRHNARLYRTIRAILRDEAEVEDAMQAAYLSAFRFLGDFAGEAAFSTWLTRIAVNEALARRRRGRWLTPVVDVAGAGPDPVATPEEQAASREAVRLLERALDQLPAAQRVVFLLREVEQVSTEDAARALGISPDAVKVRLHRARRGLRAALLAGLGPGAELGTGAREAFPFFAPRCDRVAAAVMARILGPDGAAPQSA